jgi:hypothetical protein
MGGPHITSTHSALRHQRPSSLDQGPLEAQHVTEHTIASYFAAFSSTPSWTDLRIWPPDVFALTNLLLDHTEAYRVAVSPPSGRSWPPTQDWNDMVVRAGREWRRAAGLGQVVEGEVGRYWRRLTAHKDATLDDIRNGREPEIVEALLTLHAMADEACGGLAWPAAGSPEGLFEKAAWELLTRQGSLSRISPARVRITPKTHSATRGITIRSLSRYLALAYEAIDVHWRRVEPLKPVGSGRRDFNLLLAPWPLRIDSDAFRPTEGPLRNMDAAAFGFFRFDPRAPIDIEHLARLVEMARARVGRVDALILPEGAVGVDEVEEIQGLAAELEVSSLFIGVRGTGDSGLDANFVLVSIRTTRGWESYRQAKHHRWCIDAPQIRQYHLSRALDPSKLWWEAIELPARTLEIIDVGGGAITAALVCEDLARMDEAADLVRRLGPSLVVALLLDGPQLPTRWPCRYASVLADEPGSAVLTLSSLGMVRRSQPPGKPRSRVVALWSDPDSGTHQIELARGASGIVLTTSVETKTVWTADGRCHEGNTPSLSLEAIHQIRIPRDW